MQFSSSASAQLATHSTSEPPALDWAPLNSTRARSDTAPSRERAPAATPAAAGRRARAPASLISSNSARRSAVSRAPTMRRDVALQRVDARIGMRHRYVSVAGSNAPTMRAHLVELQQPRPFGNQQPDRELNRRDVIDQIERRRSCRAARSSRRASATGETRRRSARASARPRGTAPTASTKSARVCPLSSSASTRSSTDSTALVTNAQPVAREPRQQIAMPQQMLDLDRDVVAHVRMRRVQRVDDAHRVRRAVEEIGIAERDVRGAGGDLRGDVGEHDVRLHDAELPVVDRHDRTMPAQMPAAAARFGVADEPSLGRPASAASRSARAAAAPRSIGHEEMKARNGRVRRRA